MSHHLYIETPLIQTMKGQKNIFFKLESLQPSGSFKLRGISHYCKHLVEKGANSFVASSGGNAGVAVAYCAMKMGIQSTIFIPSSSHPLFIDKIKSYGAHVIVSGNTAGQAQDAALEFASQHHSSYIHPYDHQEIWTGHSTIIAEIAKQHIIPDAVIVAVGGGGLACGLLEGMHQSGWQKVPLIAVETQGADVFSQSVEAQKPIHLSKITSRATSLGASYAAPKLLEWTKHHEIHHVVVSDEEAELGARAFAQDQRLLVELASGASLSLVYQDHPIIESYQSILVIVCGGLNISHFHFNPKHK